MPTSRGRGARKPQPRRTHNLGGCSTCRRRHVKCDQTRPQCTTCRDSGLQCGGFPSPIRWASTYAPPGSSGAEKSKIATPSNYRLNERRTAEGEQVQCGRQLSETSAPPDPGADINQHLSLRCASNEVGPFSDASLVEAGSSSDIPTAPSTSSIGIVEHDIDFASQSTELFHRPSTGSSDLDSLFDTANGLGWNDLFDPTFDFTGPLLQEPAHGDALSLLAHVANQPQSDFPIPQMYEHSLLSNQHYTGSSLDGMTTLLDAQPPPYTMNEIEEVDVLEDAKALLKHFRDILIPQFAPLPMSSKSPWEILVWSNAVQTHADMTYLQSSDIKHAKKANLFGVLGCAAHSIAKTQLYSDIIPQQKATQILDYAARRAKMHMQETLMLETSGQQKAKYKDQLMAIFSLIALATMGGNQPDARCYLIDAERLLRLRGLAKREVSRRARLLHHVYTWLRIIGESTFTLYDHSNPGFQARIEKSLQSNLDPTTNLPTPEDQENPGTDDYSQLDDFLRVKSHSVDSDSDAEAPKEQEVGIRDIHLEDLRQWSKTLYMDIYGIPEIWLSFVSQTTRLANIMEFVERTPLQAPRPFTSSLQRKINKLEHMICSFSAQHCISRSPSPARGTHPLSGTVTPKPSQASRAMLCAMSSALIIFFYRRIRKVHPWILQGHVNDTITALKEFDLAQDMNGVKGPGTPWPAFIAGCEAMSSSSREWFASWMQKGAGQSAFNGFTASQQVMREVWERRDMLNRTPCKDFIGSEAGKNIGTKKGEVYSWVDVLREGKYWLMLY